MKVFESAKPVAQFSTVGTGSVVRWRDSIWIATRTVRGETKDEIVNAVNMRSGIHCHIPFGDMVEIVEGAFVEGYSE